MIEHNANRFWSVYEKAEQLFDKVVNVGSEFEVKILLRTVNNFKIINDDVNIRM